MSARVEKQHDPWSVVEPGFERWEGPRGVDDFLPVDTQATDLGAYLRSALQAIRTPRESTETVTLPNGRAAQLSERGDGWQLAIHLGRDWFQIIEGSSREEVLSRAEAQ
jgi:hypothetical protein